MSLRNRARQLQRAAGFTYQQALARLRALGAAPAELARKWRWPLSRCDRYLIDPTLDEEWSAAAQAGAVEERTCALCGRCCFGAARDGEEACGDCRQRHPREKIDVIDLQPVSRADLLHDACETLLAISAARSVALLDRDGRVLASVSDSATPIAAVNARGWAIGLAVRGARGASASAKALGVAAGRFKELLDGSEPFAVEIGDGRSLYSTAVAKRALLLVVFDEGTSLGLVRLRVRAALAELERLLASDPRFGGPGGAPPSGGRGGPAETGLDVRALRRRRS